MPWYQRWRNVFRPERLNSELEKELQYHLAETIDRLTEDGLTPEDAELEARRRLGNYSLHKERTRDMNILAWLDATRADLLYGLRQLRQNPGFATVAILSLTLGIGANSAMFQLMNAIGMKRLPVRAPQELVLVDFQEGSTRGGWWSSRSANFTSAQWNYIRNHQQAFSGILAWSAARFNLANGGEPHFAEGLYVSGSFFDVLGVEPVLGRTLTAQGDGPQCDAAAVLSYAFWQREFGGDPGVLGRTLSIEGTRIPVIGVTGPAFFGVEVGSRYDIALPLCADAIIAGDGKGRAPGSASWWLSIMGRLKPGWTEASATTYLRTLSPAVMEATVPSGYSPAKVRLFLANQLLAKDAGTGISDLRRQYGQSLWLLMAITGVVLLITCANLANLLLARSAAREREIAVRLAIGASRGRIVRQLLAESLLLAVSGAALGGGLAALLSRALITFISTTQNPIFIDARLDWHVLAFTGGLAILTCLFFGLIPAWRATFVAPGAAIRSNGRGMSAGRERATLRQALVVTQIALSIVLLAGAVLFVRSLQKLMTADAGFRAEGVLTVAVDFSKASIAKDRRLALYRELSERFSALPGVVSAAQVGFTPLSGEGWDQLVGPDGSRAADSGRVSFFNRASPGYFRTMGTRILAGRDFDSRDTLSSPKVAIVNETFARRYFNGANPVGRTFHLEAGGKAEPLFQVIGLVANTKYHNMREEFRPVAFFPMAQNEDPDAQATYVLRVTGSETQVRSAAQAAVTAISPSTGIAFRPFSTQINESILRERLMASVSGGFGILAGILSTLGLYGVIAYMVARRRIEIGIRIALGANRASVIGLVLKEALVLLGVGLTVGVVLELGVARAAATLLYGLQPTDPLSIATASLLLIFVALAASYLPAGRAARIDPISTLRSE